MYNCRWICYCKIVILEFVSTSAKMAAANKAAPIPVTLSSLKKFTSQHPLSFILLLDFMNSNTYSGNYGNKKKCSITLKYNQNIRKSTWHVCYFINYAMRPFCFKIRSSYV